ncbi:hypothetical protein PFISCL1PPCAC_19693, partial [Pristionchus fissidentatus]
KVARRCQGQVTALGASFPAARQCILAHQGRIHQAVTCSRSSFGNVCANSAGQMVPRRYPETLQLAAFREINSILTRSGILSQATSLLQAGRRVVGCMMKCAQQNSCVKRLGCGLALPADNVVVANVKSCALQAGFTTPVLWIFGLGLVSISVVSGQMVPQCMCSTFDPCYANVVNVVAQCADKCQNHFSSLGASYPAARQCIMAKMPVLRGTLICARSRFGNVCSNTPGSQVPKRYSETIQLAAFREITGMMSRSGISTEATALVQVARKAVGCIVKCVQANGCSGKTCGLALPSDNQIIANFKSCAINSGFLTTAGFREICGCLANSGIKQLSPICSKITIS